MSKVEEFLKTIPVYPDSIKIKGVTTLPSYIGLCEDEKCNISWISDKAKEEGLRDFDEAKITHNAPKHKKEIKYTAFGKSQTLREWAKEYGINYQTLNSRIHIYGMSLGEALTKPKQTNEEKVRPRLEKRYKGGRE